MTDTILQELFGSEEEKICQDCRTNGCWCGASNQCKECHGPGKKVCKECMVVKGLYE